MFYSRRTIVPVFVYLSLLLAAVQAHDFSLQQRDHVNLKRLMRKRAPTPQGIFDPVAGAEDTPTPASSVTSSRSVTVSPSTPVPSSVLGTVPASSSSSSSTSESASTTSSSSSSSSSSSASTSAAAKTSEALNLTQPPSTSTVVAAPVTRTASVSEPSSSTSSDRQSNASEETKSTTLTVLIAVAASVGGVAIIWTIFRKWKLSSSKNDERLNPITNWQPNDNDDDNPIPVHRRRASNASSFHSGSGHGHGGRAGGYGSSDHGTAGVTSLDHDFTAGPTGSTPVGGYADLARGPSPNPQMQEHHLARGPSVNRGYDLGVPLHHQAGGYSGPYEAYDYNGQGVRY